MDKILILLLKMENKYKNLLINKKSSKIVRGLIYFPILFLVLLIIKTILSIFLEIPEYIETILVFGIILGFIHTVYILFVFFNHILKKVEENKREEFLQREKEQQKENKEEMSFLFNKSIEELTLMFKDKEITKEVLKKQYKIRAKELHPDLGGNKEDFQKLNKIKEEWGI